MFSEKLPHATHKFYAAAFVAKARMNAFLVDLDERRGWTLIAKILRIRSVNAFTAFLDQPTQSKLAALLAFDDEMRTIGAIMPPIRPGHEQHDGNQS